MAEIIEHMGDVEDMPEWVREAFETGRLYHTCVKKVAGLEQEVKDLKVEQMKIMQLGLEADHKLKQEVVRLKRQLLQTTSDYVKLEKEVERLKTDLAATVQSCEIAITDVEQLRTALEKYGRHYSDCKRVLVSCGMEYPEAVECTCGLEQALKGGEETNGG